MALKYVEDRIITSVDIEGKNWYSFSNGTVIRLERDFNNFDRKYTQQVLGVVISAENIPKDSFVLFHHNSTHETYLVNDHSQLNGEEIASGIKIFSIMERDVFFWKLPNEDEWKPTKNYATALRIFKPYEGLISGIEPIQIKDTLFVTSGRYKGKVCRTVKASDYCITFRSPETGQDVSLIRFRPDGDEDREPEVICVLNELTDKVNEGKLLIGLTKSDCKPLNELINA